MNRTLLVPFFLLPPIGFSQPQLEIGVRIDVPLVGPWTSSTAYANPQPCAGSLQCGYYGGPSFHPAIGISASIQIARRLRLRFDPIYQRIGVSNSSYVFEYQNASVNSPVGERVTKSSVTANRWQFPAMVEASFLRHLRFGLGPDVSLLTSMESISKTVDPFLGTFTSVGPFIPYFSNQVTTGATAAMEFPFRFGNVTLAPELRYKRWFNKHLSNRMWMMDEFTGGVAIRFSR